MMKRDAGGNEPGNVRGRAGEFHFSSCALCSPDFLPWACITWTQTNENKFTKR